MFCLTPTRIKKLLHHVGISMFIQMLDNFVLTFA
ncbi:hypothetical protein X841_01565 [Streptococcus thermophilus M17PTZA496]|uniref:Transposase n=1 Tax=Streptococcus thermophilus M17PTZA496 TaxID=1433289 RepID=A0A0E2Q550_STRTR|nr:hypothetical protein X841_01565 [Streptococcus thermophilus M17PTZA496]